MQVRVYVMVLVLVCLQNGSVAQILCLLSVSIFFILTILYKQKTKELFWAKSTFWFRILDEFSMMFCLIMVFIWYIHSHHRLFSLSKEHIFGCIFFLTFVSGILFAVLTVYYQMLKKGWKTFMKWRGRRRQSGRRNLRSGSYFG